MGYNKGSPAYLVCIPETGKIFMYRVVKFPRKEVEKQTQTEGPYTILYTMKESCTGAKTFKARYVAKGYSQVKVLTT